MVNMSMNVLNKDTCIHRTPLEGWMQTDHLLAPICDDPQNFFLMFRTLNNKFSFEDLLEFKKEFTGDGWEGAVELANSAVRLQLAAL